MLNYAHQWIDQGDIEAVVEVLRKVHAFENSIVSYSSTKAIVAVELYGQLCDHDASAVGSPGGESPIPSPRASIIAPHHTIWSVVLLLVAMAALADYAFTQSNGRHSHIPLTTSLPVVLALLFSVGDFWDVSRQRPDLYWGHISPGDIELG
jgi:hypothetical protein